MIRKAYFSSLGAKTEEEVMNRAWDNTEGDSPYRAVKIKDAYGWVVFFRPDQSNSKEKK